MAKLKVRQVNHSKILDFDEQVWPVNVLLVILAGFESGVIIALSDFHEPRLLYNGWFHLGVVAVLVLLLALGVVLLKRRMQRRMQLAILISLLVHLMLCPVLRTVYMARMPVNESNKPVVEETKPAPLPVYHMQEPDQATPTDSVERAVETTPQDIQSPDVKKAETKTEPKPQEKQPTPESATVAVQMPTPVDLKKAEVSAPHRSQQLSGPKIARRETETKTPTEVVPVPKTAEAEPKATSPMEANVTPLQRQQSETKVERTAVAEKSSAAPQAHRQAQMERRQSPDQQPQAATASRTPQRQATQTATNVTTQVTAQPTPTKSNDTPTPLADPKVAQVQRQNNNPPVAKPSPTPVAESSPAPAVKSQPQVARAAPTDTPATSNPTAATSPQRTVRQAAPTTETALSPAASPAASSSQATANLQPNSTSVARQTPAALPGASMANNAPSAAAGTSGNVSAAATQPNRATAPGSSSAGPSSTQPAQLARAQGAAKSDVSPALVDAPSLASGPAANEPAAEPARMSVSRASGGAPGLTRQRNFDSDMPAANATASVSSTSARRAQATQQMAPGSAASPSAPARSPRSLAGAESSTATLQAEMVTVADAAGSQQPSTVQASSSASATRAAAQAPTGRVTADVGSSSIDLGPTAIASKVGEGRTSGGGEPTMTSSTQPSPLARSSAAGQTMAAVPAEQIGVTPSSSGTQSNSPAGLAVNAPSTTIARGNSGLGRPQLNSPPGGGATSNSTVGDSGGATALAGNVGPARRSDSDGGSPGAGTSAGVPSRSPGRTIVGAGDSPAEMVQVAGPVGTPGATPSNGPAGTGQAQPTVSGPTRQSAGLPGTIAGRPTPNATDNDAGPGGGDEAGPVSIADAGPRRADGVTGAVPAMTGSIGPAPPMKRNGGTIGTSGERADEPAVVAMAPGAPGPNTLGSADGQLAAATGAGVPRQQLGGLPIRIAAEEGPGGLGHVPAADPGIPNRRARSESDVVHQVAGRFILERSGGLKAFEARVKDTAVPGFQQRDPELRKELAKKGGGSEGSERALEMGLDFLVRHQNPDGSWSLHNFGAGRPGYATAGQGQMQSDTAGTGLALLAFLGAGYTHLHEQDDSHRHFRQAVERGVAYLVQNQKPDGDLFVGGSKYCWLYSHGIASIALCEAYGMTRDPQLQQPAQKCLDFIAAAQSPTEGGWRYTPRLGTDTSVSGWQIMALKSGELSGLKVPPQCYSRVSIWLDSAQGSNPALYVYRPQAEQAHQRTPSIVMTAEALLMRQYLGWKQDEKRMVAGADYIRANLPQFGTAARPERNAYYWYYATQFMNQMQGVYWNDWNNRLRDLLTTSQTQSGALAGSWDPNQPTPDRWGREGGRIYVTTMHLLMLEVYYRRLPLYQDLSGAGK